MGYLFFEMDDDESYQDLLTLFVLTAGILVLKSSRSVLRKGRRRRRWAVRPINRNRANQGEFFNLFQELKNDDEQFFKYTRMTVVTFNKLLTMLSPLLEKKCRTTPLSSEQRLAMTLRYLSTGDQQQSIAWGYRVGKATVSLVIREVCRALWLVLSPLYLAPPSTQQWLDIASGFLENWNFPNCVGALDGKHVIIQAPHKSGSKFFNYKKTFSTVLMATCDSNYCFTTVDIGQYGSHSDSSIFSNSLFGNSVYSNETAFPSGVAKLPGSNIALPCFLVGDEAFPLRMNLMRPYSGKNLPTEHKIFNYRLSRARRTIENAFGILGARWRIFRRPICAGKKTVDLIVMATVCLHNFIKKEEDVLMSEDRLYCPPCFVDTDNCQGQWRTEETTGMTDIGRTGANRGAREAYSMRDTLAVYLTSPEGEVPWQNDYINRGKNAEC